MHAGIQGVPTSPLIGYPPMDEVKYFNDFFDIQGKQQWEKLKELLGSMQADHLVLGSLQRQKNDFEILK